MPFDSTCKFLAETYSGDIATWLLGHPLPLTKLEPSELSVEPIRADSLIFLESEGIILHIEFQVEPRADIPFRCADYRLRLYRRSPNKRVRQVVIYLKPSSSPLVYQPVFEIEGMRHAFEVVRLWECPVEQFLDLPGLLPFAVLGQATNREQVLEQVAPRIEAIAERRQQSNLAASTAILAGLVLEKAIIQRVLKQDIMKESVIYQEIEAEGFQRGVQQGLHQGERSIILRLLAHRVGPLTPEVRSQVEALSLEQLEALGEALLDFSYLQELTDWLQAQRKR